MTPIVILQILEGLLGAAPQVLALFQRASSGQAVTPAEVQQVLTQYNLDHQALVDAIAAAEATPPSAGGS